MEAEVGIEPTHKAFAEPCLTTWLLRLQKKPIPFTLVRASHVFSTF